MLLTVISSPETVTREAETVNALFEAGLAVLHLRKPASTAAEVEKLLARVDAKFHSMIALHEHHRYADEWGISRLHFPEKTRMEFSEEKLAQFHEENYLSTSVHSVHDLHALPALFDYVMAGPVFDSISKPGYKGNAEILGMKAHRESMRLIAVGGIDETNIRTIVARGFDGAALLGAIWNSKEPVRQFEKIRSWCEVNAGLNKEAFNF